jgi:myxalamid-type polyketide synthase MxaB
MVDMSQRLAGLTPAQRELLESRLKKQQPTNEPIAIVGMACRLPGAPTLSEYWKLIQEQRSAFREMEDWRWDVEGLFDSDPDTPGHMATRSFAILEDIDKFDAKFFSIAPREAGRMDVQQRLVLECAWEAFEHAGIPIDQLAGTATGVFMGIGSTDYSKMAAQRDDFFDLLDSHVGTGNALSIAANRISYLFDFRGPSLAVDTACSSGLVCVHTAVNSLRTGESDVALAGAVNAILSPETSIAFSKARMLSPTGRCRPFDADANGYVRGEGAGVLVLKRLSDATRDGDNVLAVIRGTAINQDGRTSGITAPNAISQQACIRAAVANSGLSVEEINYVEAHGTGTPLGDPIEFQSLTKLFPKKSAADKACYVTSVKANVGHTETLSGVASLIKVVQMMSERTIPGQTGLETLNPNIKLDGSRLEIPRESLPWEGPMVAGINSFGFGGTNSHVIVATAPAAESSTTTTTADRPKHLINISAKSKEALPELAKLYAEQLESLSEEQFADFCASTTTTRVNFDHRAAMVVDSKETGLKLLNAVADDKRGSGMKKGAVRLTARPKVAFLFTGQGSQYPGMGKSLYESHPVFRAAIDRCDEILTEHREHSLKHVMFTDDTGLVAQTEYTQPALFALEYAVATLWRSWGVEPSLVMGHSVGEYVAACFAGVFSLEDGLLLIAKRGELMQKMPPNGKMAVVFGARDRVEDVIRDLGDRIVVATANGPENNVISGDGDLVDKALAAFDEAGLGCQQLTVSHAFHSPLMDPMLDEFEAFASKLEYKRPQLPLVANRTGEFADEPLDAAYWRDHLRNCVEFEKSIVTAAADGIHAFVEVGPTASLLGMGKRCVTNSDAVWAPSLRKGRDDWATLLASVVDLHVSGVQIDWAAFERPWQRQRIGLPYHPQQKSHYWLFEDKGRVQFGGCRGAMLHPLLGSAIVTSLDTQLFENRLRSESPRYLKDHEVQGSVVVPAAAYLEQGLAAAEQMFGAGPHAIEDVAIRAAMFLVPDGGRVVQMAVSPPVAGRASFDTLSADVNTEETPNWETHAAGNIVQAEETATAPASPFVPTTFQADATGTKERTEYYELMADRGLNYGDAFQVLGSLARSGKTALAKVQLPPSVTDQIDDYHLHPALGDAMMQAVAGVVPLEEDGSFSPSTYMPVRIERLQQFARPTAAMQIYVERTSDNNRPSPDSVQANVYLLTSDNEVIATAMGVTVMRVGGATTDAAEDVTSWLFANQWNELELESPATSLKGKSVAVFAQQGTASWTLAQSLQEAGASVTVIAAGETASPVQECDGLPTATIRIAEFADYAALDALTHCDHAVYAWSLAADPSGLDTANDLTCTGSLLAIQALAKSNAATTPTIYLVTSAAQPVTSDAEAVNAIQAPLWGMGRVAAMEVAELGCRLIDLSGDATTDGALLVAEIAAGSTENQVAFRDGKRYVLRLDAAPQHVAAGPEKGKLRIPSERPFKLKITTPGSFDALQYGKFQPPAEGADNFVELEVKATGLNFSDVLKAMGLYPGLPEGEVPLGIECGGVVTKVGPAVTRFQVGDKVMGVAPGCFASHTSTLDHLLVAKPDNLDFEEASTIPITFLTAYYGMIRLAQLQKGERILIHAGAGGVGISAIQIAKAIGCEIFATAGSDEKREFLKSLGVDHVMNSRTLEFADEIMKLTDMEGVDVVLNSLAGDAIQKSLSCLRAYGRFLEIGKTDIYSNSKIGLLPFQDNLSYFAIDLDRMLRQRPEYITQMFTEMMERFHDGTYQALPFTSFGTADVIEAYRYMAQRKNIGKVVVAMDDESTAGGDRKINAEGTVLITGGLGALGLQVAEWLTEQGAGGIALLSRRAPDEQKQAKIAELKAAGTKVVAVQGDVSDVANITAAIDQIPADFPPLKGVIHAAGVLADGIMFDMDLEQLRKPLASKIDGTWNLHAATKERELDFFVMFSSVASVLGSPGQSNYAAGNAFLDSMAAYRRSQNLPAVTINWGPWADSGMAAEAGRDSNVESKGMRLLPSGQALDLMGELVQSNEPQTIVMSVSWIDLLQAMNNKVTPLLSDITADIDINSGGSDADRALRESLAKMNGTDQIAALTTLLQTSLANIMGLEPEDIDPSQALTTMGLDSLMAIELKNKIERQLQLTLPMSAFMNEPTVATLATTAADIFGNTSTTPAPTPATDSVARIDEANGNAKEPMSGKARTGEPAS